MNWCVTFLPPFSLFSLLPLSREQAIPTAFDFAAATGAPPVTLLLQACSLAFSEGSFSLLTEYILF
jgi:hypothetical protein